MGALVTTRQNGQTVYATPRTHFGNGGPMDGADVMDIVRVDPVTGCWLYPGLVAGGSRPEDGMPRDGYGYVYVGDTQANYRKLASGCEYAHRVTWEYFNGPIPYRLVPDHLCEIKLCCNPGHLEIITQAENMARARRQQRFEADVHRRDQYLEHYPDRSEQIWRSFTRVWGKKTGPAVVLSTVVE